MIQADNNPFAIPAGFRIIVDSWENDGDASATATVSGIQTEAEVRFYVKLLELLAGDFGNMYDPSDDEIAAFVAAVRAVMIEHTPASLLHSDVLSVADLSDADVQDFAHEILSEFTGYGGENYYTRVVEKVQVALVAATVLFPDVTSQFVGQ